MSAPHDPSRNLFELAVDLSPSGLLVVDGEGSILLVNREIERLFGHPREALVGQSIELLVPRRFHGAHPAHRDRFYADPHARAMGAGRDLHGLRRDGTEFPVEIGLNPVRTDHGLLVLASVVDITARREAEQERRRLEDQLRQSQKLEAIGTLAGGIAHDFNNILLAILGYAELARDATGEPAVRADLDRVVAGAIRGRELVHRILAFSRRREPKRTPTRLEPPLREALELLRASLPATIEMRERLDPATPAVLVDEVDVHQVVMNLATNAAQAMPHGGVLEVSLAPVEIDAAFAARHPPLRPGPHARLTVCDTGGGIPAEILDRIFEPFFTTKPVGEGTGLGLSVILGLVTGFGGAIEVTSRVGEGTKVHVHLPAVEGTDARPGMETAPAPEPAARVQVLLVDDEEVLAELERRQLVALGLDVTVRTSSVEALREFREAPDRYDLLITDNTMPELTGLDLAGQVHRIRPELPILMVSGLGDTIDVAGLRERGIRHVLRKPHTGSELALAVQTVIGSK